MIKHDLFSSSAIYRLVGVVTIGITKIPIIGFGYPEHSILTRKELKILLKTLETQGWAELLIAHPDAQTDHIEWIVHSQSSGRTASSAEPVRLFLEFPVEVDHPRESSELFSRSAVEGKGFLVAVTIENNTLLCFYDLNEVEWDSGTRVIHRVTGHPNKFVQGPAVPLLRSIETLRPQVAPQRKIQVADEELGIIYQSLFQDVRKIPD
jgi:hypothetical protein